MGTLEVALGEGWWLCNSLYPVGARVAVLGSSLGRVVALQLPIYRFLKLLSFGFRIWGGVAALQLPICCLFVALVDSPAVFFHAFHLLAM